ncbi:hypothetical protein DFH09DRAFT_1088015 [Mycena vulgaris]|nr:hypothetical protein DFH09DRAFT_1088015 [Mycena vulgaris]
MAPTTALLSLVASLFAVGIFARPTRWSSRSKSDQCQEPLFNLIAFMIILGEDQSTKPLMCIQLMAECVSLMEYVPLPNIWLYLRCNYYSLNHAKISTDLMVGDLDGNGNRRPQGNCIYYVNQQNVDADDPSSAKNRAVQFGDLMNAAYPGSDYLHGRPNGVHHGGWQLTPTGSRKTQPHTPNSAPARSTSSYAEPQQIWSESIWVAHELPALYSNPAINQVIEMRQEDVGQGVAGVGNLRYIRYYPSRGGQLHGATPPRDGDKLGDHSRASITRTHLIKNSPASRMSAATSRHSRAESAGCTSTSGRTRDHHLGRPRQPEPGNKIGYIKRTNANDPHALEMTSKLESVLRFTPEEANDYIQFNLGALSFTSRDSCTVGAWLGRWLFK